MRSQLRMISCAVSAGLVGIAGCHRASPPPTPTPAFTNTGAGTDDAAARAAAMARADAARRDSIARADSLRRIADAARNADDARRTLLQPVHFEFDRDQILASEASLLDRKVTILRDNPSLQIRIEGNADERGSDEYNLALGMRRAAAVERYIEEHGIPAARMSTASNGEEHPVCSGHDESCWSLNRRDDVAITAAGNHLVP